MGELEVLRNPQAEPPASRRPIVGTMINLLRFLAPRWYVDSVIGRQREFNDAVVRAFETQRYRNTRQDRLNREQTAELMLIAFTALGRFQSIDRQDESRPKDCQTDRLL